MPIDFEQLVSTSGDAVVVADPEGAIVLWNAAAERLFGWTAEEALGRSLDLIIPERLRARHWDGYWKVMQSGTTRYGSDILRVPAEHKEGRRLSIAFTVGLLKSADGKVTGITSIIRDDTARWEDERALRKRLADLETELEAAQKTEPGSKAR